MKRLSVLLLILWLPAALAQANINPLPLPEDRGQPVGQILLHTAQEGDTLASLARYYGVSPILVLAANPEQDLFLLQPGQEVVIPNQLLLPRADTKGIVINLAELRLYYYPEQGDEVYVFPIGIGRVGRATPEMITRISQMRKNPTWTPTATTRREYEAKGLPLPAVVPAGPDNPLGEYAMRLAYGRGEYLIHGTNDPLDVGLRASAGCIRMYPEHVEWLFAQVDSGTQVQIVNQALKVSTDQYGQTFVEAHEPLTPEGLADERPLDMTALAPLLEQGANRQLIEQVIQNQQGMPQLVGQLP
ncbi:L,D-transpeptidase ErfK/SrfK/L,D-transpeptidase YcfS [Oceanisphaera litoralis]|uniref:L,D-transpeptidase family protein n=1 Tax=Oceanisphaera litoralis TaxID=225144 RepID=UPI001959243E|nr:L,D-transpeptidase family protein [Oceanisphaera litoralis]MBM7455007.1 L,D-transpeptidase ErfK/SrfK/L,D-transpeptidase YcfS [Oceanisphaera litoralis]